MQDYGVNCLKGAVMQAYELKDSGVDCLGNIPSHWVTGKIKNRFFLKPSNVDKKSYDDEIPVELCNYVDVYYNDFITNDLVFMSATATDYEIQKFSLNIDDVIITKDSEDPMDIGVPALVKEVKPNLVCGYHLTMLRKRPCHVSGSFLFWALKDEAIASQFYREATGVTRWAISSRNIKNVAIAYPKLNEQKTIADYLDQACQSIDKTISLKQQQLLNISEQYKSKIIEVIRKGLNKEVALKNSNSEWLGQVPIHWQVKSIKRVTEIIRGKFTHRPRNDPAFYNGNYPFIQTGNVTNAQKYITSYSQTLNEKGYAVSKEFPAGTLTMTIAANIADVAILNFNACFPDSIVGFKPLHMVSVEYLYYMFFGLREDLLSTAILTTQLNLNIVRVGTIKCVIPPKNEQAEIVSYLNALNQNTETLKENIKSQS